MEGIDTEDSMIGRMDFLDWLDDLVDLYENDKIDEDKLTEILIGHECVRVVKRTDDHILIIESVFGQYTYAIMSEFA